MILVTIGTQLAFDRLIRAVDAVAPDLDEPIFGQIGPSRYVPEHFESAPSINPSRFSDMFRAARVIVAHAGIGTILNAQQHGKPIILCPRRAEFGEHRNDHQLATCAQLKDRPGIHLADDLDLLGDYLRRGDLGTPAANQATTERARLTEALRSLIHA